jgi:hypothetical protein
MSVGTVEIVTSGQISVVHRSAKKGPNEGGQMSSALASVRGVFEGGTERGDHTHTHTHNSERETERGGAGEETVWRGAE